MRPPVDKTRSRLRVELRQEQTMPMKLGRRPRTFNPAVPHLSAVRLMLGAPLPVPPPTCDYRKGTTAWGMMDNDQLGDCTCAAAYHALQVWSLDAEPEELTEPDADVLAFYERFGYVPGNPNTDQGANEQDVLTSWLTKGLPRGPKGVQAESLVAFVEVDPRNHTDVMLTIAECGVAYIGFNVPSALMANAPNIPTLWDTPAGGDIDGGHAVVLCGYDAVGPYVISWGSNYQMTWAFFDAYVDEVYALADKAWIASTGVSPFGLSLSDLQAQMAALKQ